ncbi:RNA recognition motif (RRM)-containing protein [Actinidia rufa]|uniref:RNA recognition motif (RRM)-containing protein n=1 Tax=Actinidia rufa TaxID=165716 RepID=A0A7J0DT76_9ERIC|nr:RNA recognition motif (RRM)-containing protein [Actinidia rufa]
MNSFSITRKKTPFQKHREEEEAKKKRAEDETARLYQEFVESFQGDNAGPKAFVRGGTINPNERLKNDSEDTSEREKIANIQSGIVAKYGGSWDDWVIVELPCSQRTLQEDWELEQLFGLLALLYGLREFEMYLRGVVSLEYWTVGASTKDGLGALWRCGEGDGQLERWEGLTALLPYMDLFGD